MASDQGFPSMLSTAAQSSLRQDIHEFLLFKHKTGVLLTKCRFINHDYWIIFQIIPYDYFTKSAKTLIVAIENLHRGVPNGESLG
jgi:hypothetical protein